MPPIPLSPLDGGDHPNVRRRRLKKHQQHAAATAKQALIHEALAARDLPQLRELARSRGGILTNALRREVWPVLLHCSADQLVNINEGTGVEELPRDAAQIALDVNRSLSHLLPPDTQDRRLFRMRKDLSKLMLGVFRKHPYLHYYQGYHDVASIFLLVLRPSLASSCLESLSLYYLRDFMTLTLQSALNQIHLLLPLIALSCPPIHAFLLQIDGFLPYFCLSWIITWYSHDLTDTSRVARLFDFLLASNPLMPVYVAAAVLMTQKDRLLEEEAEYSNIHHFLSRLPPEMSIESLIKQAQNLHRTHPPRTLQKRAKLDLGPASCVNRYEDDLEGLTFEDPLDIVLPEKLVDQHGKSSAATVGPPSPTVLARTGISGLERWVGGAKQVVWIAVFAATTAIAWYALEIGSNDGYQ
ncbi:hypothetical protein HKX48_007008 [Thoreauomyces humboldtii]|nr:hypothetical protein HKX48_007008 [Thoreauomyces humboldtii]